MSVQLWLLSADVQALKHSVSTGAARLIPIYEIMHIKKGYKSSAVHLTAAPAAAPIVCSEGSINEGT